MTEQAKHTPGPWFDMGLGGHPRGPEGELHTIKFGHGTAEEGNRSSGHVATVHVLHSTEEARAIARANARLIAAAPDLLAALELAAAQLSHYEPVAPFIRAAIAKARDA